MRDPMTPVPESTVDRVRAWRPLRVRALARLLALIALVVTGVLLAPESASAHSNLLFSSPSAEATVPTAPSQVSLTFDHTITTAGSPVTVTGPHGVVATSDVMLADGGTALSVRLPPGQGPGVYTVQWQVTASDGDVMAGRYQYAVGPRPLSLGASTADAGRGAWETAVLRFVLFGALAVALGELAGRWLFRRIGSARSATWSIWACVAGAAAGIGLVLLQLGAGSLVDAVTRPALAALLTLPGLEPVAEAFGFLVAGILTRTRRPAWAVLPLVLVVAAEAVRAHPGTLTGPIGAGLTAIHLAAAALWVGALIYLLRTVAATWRQPGVVVASIRAYAGPAAWLFAAVAATGLVNALLLVPFDQAITTGYGRILLIKIALVAVITAVAAVARWRLQRAHTAARIRRPARWEAGLLVGVIALSAVLTVLPPPADSRTPLPFAPPPNGPVEPLAALAGSVTITAEASAGQLVVRLHRPDLFGPAEHAPMTATLTGAVADPRGKVTNLTFRGCGEGCFTAPVTWHDGNSRLTLSSAVSGEAPVQTGSTVVWPILPAEDLLARTISTMNGVGELTLHEKVTANNPQGGGGLRAFSLDGAEYIRRSLFASGKVPAMVRLPDVDGNSRLLLSYPSMGAVEDLTIAPDGRILHETLTATDLVTHTFEYPE